MKRDMDLVRNILLALEESNSDPLEWVNLKFDGRSDLEVSYHIRLLNEAGLIDAIDASSMDGTEWHAQCLTAFGHDYLDSVRDPEIWAQTKEGAKKVGGFSLEVLGAIAKGLLKKKIEEHTGVEIDL